MQFVSTIVISHLLTPTQIGIYSLAAAGIGLAHMFRDFGIGTYIAQEQELTHTRIRAAQTVAYLTAWPLAALLYFGAGYAGDFYHQQGVAQVMHWLSLNFLLLPVGTVLNSYLNRNLNFGITTSINVASATLGFVVTLSAAVLGASYMSMVWGSLTSTIITILILRLVKPHDFPSVPGYKELPRVLSIGMQVSIGNILRELGTALPEILLGKVQGINIVAFFSRANGGVQTISRIAMDGVRPVITPAFAKLQREGGDVPTAYHRAHLLTMAATWPALFLLFIFAKPAVLLLFGSQWLPVAPLLRILVIARLLYIPSAYAEGVLMGTSHVGAFLTLQIADNLLRIVAVGSLVWFGVQPMLWGYTGALAVRYIFVATLARKLFGTKLKNEFSAIISSTIIAVSTVALPLIILVSLHRAPGSVGPATLFGLGALAAIAWLASLYLLRNPLWDEIQRIVHQAVRPLIAQLTQAR